MIYDIYIYIYIYIYSSACSFLRTPLDGYVC